MLWLVLKTGWELDRVREMDVISFNAICAILTKLVYREKKEDAWVRMVAAQGQKETMTSITSAWEQATSDQSIAASRVPANAQGPAAFLQALKLDPRRGGRF